MNVRAPRPPLRSRLQRIAAVAVLFAIALAVPSASRADDGHWRHGRHHGHSHGHGWGGPVYAAPRYYAPRPILYAPGPAFYPAPVYVAPPPVYVAPPPPVPYVAYGYGGRPHVGVSIGFGWSSD